MCVCVCVCAACVCVCTPFWGICVHTKSDCVPINRMCLFYNYDFLWTLFNGHPWKTMKVRHISNKSSVMQAAKWPKLVTVYSSMVHVHVRNKYRFYYMVCMHGHWPVYLLHITCRDARNTELRNLTDKLLLLCGWLKERLIILVFIIRYHATSVDICVWENGVLTCIVENCTTVTIIIYCAGSVCYCQRQKTSI